MGVAVGDFDNDGLPDIYVTGYGHNVLYHNLGGCKFEDVTEKYHLAAGGFSVGAAWGDYDRDGRLDLFVSRYVNSDIRNLPQPGSAAFNYQGLPMEVPVSAGETDFLFHAKPGGGFEDVSEKAGVSNPDKRLGMGVIWADYDNDGWPDLFVTNDMGPNFLYHNKHDGTFEDLGLVTGTALSAEGRSMGNMAGDFSDYDHSGWLGLVVTRYGYQPMTLYANQSGKDFADVTWASQIGKVSYSPVRWGAGFADFDNDGWPDIFVANGNVTPIVDTLPNDSEIPRADPVLSATRATRPSRKWPTPLVSTMARYSRAAALRLETSITTATSTSSSTTSARRHRSFSTKRKTQTTAYSSVSSAPRATRKQSVRA